MIYKSNLDQSSPTGWTAYVMPERCDVRGAEREIFTNSGLEYGRWYLIRGKAPNAYAFSIVGNQFATALNSRLRKDVNALIYTHFGEDYPARKEAAIKEKGKDIYTGIRNNVIGFYREDEFDIPNGVQEIPPVAPKAEEKVEPMETPKVATGAEPVKPLEEPGVETVELPSTMAALTRMLSCMSKRSSKYDFGVRTVAHAVAKPTITATIKAYRKVVLLAIARALVARKFGMEFSTRAVIRAVAKDWRNSATLKRYSEVMGEHRADPIVREVVTEMQKTIIDFIDGNVDCKYSFMSEWKGQKWSIESFLKYSWSRFKVTFKRNETTKKAKKKSGVNLV
jgi:hypothetical protein